MDRVEVWAQDKNVFKPVMAFRHGDAPKPKEKNAWAEPTNPAAVRWVALVSDTHVLMQNAGKEMLLVEIPAGKVVWKTRLAGTPNMHSGSLPALSPDRKLAAIPVDNGIALVDTMSGKVLNALPASTEKISVSGVGFSPDGKQLAALAQVHDAFCLQVYDLSTGQTTSDFPLSTKNGIETAPQFVAPGFVRAGHSIISLEKKTIVWQYQGGAMQGYGLRVGSVVPYTRTFYITEMQGRVPAACTNVELPDAQAAQAIAALSVDDLYIWAPGMKVNLQLNVVGDENYRKAQLAEWTKRLKERGIEVDEKSPNTLRVNNMILNGQGIQYEDRMSKETMTTHTQYAGYDMALVINGQEHWKVQFNKAPEEQARFGPMFITVLKKPGESMQQAYDREHPQMTTASTIIMPPMYILKDIKINTTNLDAQGQNNSKNPATPRPPRRQRP